MKVAIVHEWLTTYAGSEKVMEAMLQEYPDADIFCLIDDLPKEHRAWLADRHVRTSFLQRVPRVKAIYRYLLPLMPIAIEQHDLSKYDVIISNSHAVAKGVITGPDQLHICYCYTPMRYAWDLQNQYLTEAKFDRGLRGGIARFVLHQMRMWDVRTASNVDHFIACSHYIARRIQKAYRRASTVIYPNVAVDDFVPGQAPREDFYFTSSRMVPYKKIQLIVEAFSKMPDRRLIVIGAGPQFAQIKALAGSNVTLLGYQPNSVLLDHLQRAKAFIFAAEEDFGIAPLEAQACGTPVLAFGKGGASETVIDGITGLHFWEQSVPAICDVVRRFEIEGIQFDPVRMRAHVERFSTQRFRSEFREFVEARWAEHQSKIRSSANRTPDGSQCHLARVVSA
ncbi:glycosyltransferase family 4 protein [Microvirga massiliensis]|uniref:glycosyltransferase family 4 protein n=1 Tax=Microvirga massiliensis TaxID=1033741 RepID=UPI00062B5FD7|nr:glycosyltransferase family 4 protein [Microvirga massiliensis]